MKKFLSVLCAAMLCVCCLVLAACGGGASSSSAESSSASSSSASSASQADPADKFVGTWKLAGALSDGLVIAGDLSNVVGSNVQMVITLEKGGKGSMSMSGESANLTWEMKGSDAIVVKPESTSGSSGGSTTTIDAKYSDETLIIDTQDQSFSATMVFTKDGKLKDMPEISASSPDAKPITSEDALVGTWTLRGVSISGAIVYGDTSQLAALMGTGTDTKFVIEKGGAAKIMGGDATVAVTSTGATLTVDGVSIPLVMLDNDIIVDMTSVMGSPAVLAFSK